MLHFTRKVLSCILFLVLVVSCTQTISWHTNDLIDTRSTAKLNVICLDVNEKSKPDIIRAIDTWNNALQNWVTFLHTEEMSGASCDVLITEVETSDDPLALAWTSKVGGNVVYLIKGKYEFDAFGVVLHEMGHVLGAQHVHGTLMNKTYDKKLYSCPDAITVAQVAAWNKVSLDILRWCYR
jgi:hypothetical protein